MVGVPHNFTVKIIDTIEVARKTIEVRFEKPEGFVYQPGQFVMLFVPRLVKGDHKQYVRSMSLSSAPHEEYLSTTMRIPDDASPYKQSLMKLKTGDEIQIRGPLGRLTLQDDDAPAVFIAGGIGVTPFKSMIEDAANNDWPRKIYLFYVNRTPADAAYMEEFQKFKNDRFVPVCTMTKDPDYGGEHGYIDVPMLRRYVTEDNPHYYIVGLPPMVKDMVAKLKDTGVTDDQITLELYAGYQ